MKVTMLSEERPRIYILSNGEYCDLDRVDQHIRALQVARRWLVTETERRAKT